jgi:hypothetical protein
VNAAVAQERLVMGRGGAVGDRLEIGPGKDEMHALGGRDGREVEMDDPTPRHFREAEGEVQTVLRHGDVVDIARGAGDMQRRGVMGQGLVDAHGATSSTETGFPDMSSK